jgi:hypothetical protein
MARQFNGTNQALTASINLASATVVSVSFWLWWDAFSNIDDFALEFVNGGSPGGFSVDMGSGYLGGCILVADVNSGTTGNRFGGLTRPSAAAWHHYLIVFDVGGNAITSYIDGSVVTLNSPSGTSSGTFKASADTLSVMARNGASLWGAGRMADLAIWKSGRSSGDAATLAAGARANTLGTAPDWYWRIDGTTSPEPATLGGVALTLVGAPTQVADPPVFSGPSAYLFGAGNSNRIEVGTLNTTGVLGVGGKCSLAIRFNVTSANAARRVLFYAGNAGGTIITCLLDFFTGATNQIRVLNTSANGSLFPAVAWTSGFTAGSTHVVVVTYDGADWRIYADGDATAKATGHAFFDASYTGPGDESTAGSAIGGLPTGAGTNLSADSTIYEVAWYPGVVLTGAQAAAHANGTQMAATAFVPTNYWGFLGNANDIYAANNGTVTGASLVSGSGTNWFPAVSASAPTILGHPTTFFPIGASWQPHANFATWAARGINTVYVIPRDWWYPYSDELEAWETGAISAGLKTIRTPRQTPSADIGDTTLLAWDLNDEPELKGLNAAQMVAVYKQLRAVDATRPVGVNFAGTSLLALSGFAAPGDTVYTNMIAGADWVAQDIYPVATVPSPNNGNLALIGQAVDKVTSLAGGRPAFCYIESANQMLGNNVGPTADQLRAELWSAIIHGARGIFYYATSWGGHTPIVLSEIVADNTVSGVATEMGTQHARITGMATILQTSINPAALGVTVPSPLEVGWRISGGTNYVIVLNLSNATHNAQAITLSGAFAGSSSVVRGESRSVGISGGVITDDFTAYAVHIYEVAATSTGSPLLTTLRHLEDARA